MKKILFILFLISVSFGLCAQRNFAAKKLLLIQESFTCPSVGDIYQGGVVVYLFTTGDPCYVHGECHGIIAMTTDLSTGAPWGCAGTLVSPTNLAYCSGHENDNLILSACSESGIAAKICEDYNDGTYSDWVLPSFNDLQRSIISQPSYFVSGQYYWAGSQLEGSADYAHRMSTTTITFGYKASNYRVKAVRYF